MDKDDRSIGSCNDVTPPGGAPTTEVDSAREHNVRCLFLKSEFIGFVGFIAAVTSVDRSASNY